MFRCLGNLRLMFLDNLGAFGVKIRAEEAPMVKNRKIFDFCTACALSTTVVDLCATMFLCIFKRTYR